MIRPFALAALLAASVAAPALAAPATTLPGMVVPPPAPQADSPAMAPAPTAPLRLEASERDAVRALFADIRAGRYGAARAALAAGVAGMLTPIAQAELWLAPKSGLPDAAALSAWLASHPDLPQAEALSKMAERMAIKGQPSVPQTRTLRSVGGSRARLRSVTTSAAGRALADRLQPLLREDRPRDAEALFRTAQTGLSAAERSEWAQQIAWAYYLVGDDARAQSVAAEAAAGPGDWAVMADWVRGLAAFRSRDCTTAIGAFGRVASNSGDNDTSAGGHYWAARAALACGHPDLVATRLRSAAAKTETFYGLLAAQALGLATPAPKLVDADWRSLASNLPAAVQAGALVAIGERTMADKVLRQAALTTSPADHARLVGAAAALNLPNTQVWLAQHVPDGAQLTAMARFPTPDWTPTRGWRVDKALIFAHALQESRFATDAVSGAGARGVMQLMPGTAQLVASQFAETIDMARLGDPANSLEYGQAYLERLRDSPYTGGLLPKVIAAYSAGPGALKKWAEKNGEAADPLLFIESIPYWETRHYVGQVLRNYWIYERNEGRPAVSLEAMAQGLWPRFPGQPGATAVRLSSPRQQVARAD